jgi:hypothetical protein
MKLLSIGNAKTRLGEELNVLTGILYLNPAVNEKLCPFATDACREICLVKAGRAEFMPNVMIGRTRKTEWFLSDRVSFLAQLHKDIEALRRKAKRQGMKAAIRLNGTSDILWERLIDMNQYPDVQFYDYTKIPLKHRKLTRNYHLTFSFSGDNEIACNEALASGFNVAVVFERNIPKAFNGRKVIDGTTHDVRFKDRGKGLYVGLCAKGKIAKQAAKAGSKFFVKA